MLSATPIGTDMPGVEVHAQLIEQILQQTFLARPDWVTGAEIVFTLLAGIVLVVLLPRIGAVLGAGLGGDRVAIACGASWYAFRDQHLLLDPAYPIVVLTVVYLIATLLNHRHTERRQREIRHAFCATSRRISSRSWPSNPEKLVLGGEITTMTIMFCDIRGFTTLSEGIERRRS